MEEAIWQLLWILVFNQSNEYWQRFQRVHMFLKIIVMMVLMVEGGECFCFWNPVSISLEIREWK